MYDVASNVTLYRKILELEEQVEKLNKEIEKLKDKEQC